MKQLIQKLGTFPYYVFGVVIFFLTHGYSENVGLIPFSDILIFFFFAVLISVAILIFFSRKLKSFLKAGIITALLLFFYLFYGAIQDALKNTGLLIEISRYRVLLPLMIIIVLLSYYFIRASQKNLFRITFYLNNLFVLLILIDIASATWSSARKYDVKAYNNDQDSPLLTVCSDCSKPDIYLIVMDEYCGTSTLKNYFGYDNSWFISFLKENGFYTEKNGFSNYSSTPLSMASTFNMQYIDWMKGRKNVVAEDYALGAKTISNSVTINYLKSLEYEIKNYSIFDIAGQPSKFNFGILPIKLRLITSKTLLGRMENDLSWNIRVKVASKWKWLADKFQNQFKEGNAELLRITNKEIESKSGKPKFVYTHLMMPHFPCLYDSVGKELSINFFDESQSQQDIDNAYLQYHVYASKIARELLKNILAQSQGNAAIILMSDHGYRGYGNLTKYLSSDNNFYSVFLPSKNYHLFYDSMSNVNQFRVVFNTLFNQHLPVLKDSIAF